MNNLIKKLKAYRDGDAMKDTGLLAIGAFGGLALPDLAGILLLVALGLGAYKLVKNIKD